MLKIRTFLLALLGVSPLIFLTWQLPNEATVISNPTKDTAPTLSGYGTPIAQASASPASTFNNSPSKGPAGSVSGSVGNGSNGTVFTTPSGIIQLVIPVSSSIRVLRNRLVIVIPQTQSNLNQIAINIINLRVNSNIIAILLGNSGGVTSIQNITNRFINFGISETLTTRFTRSCFSLFRYSGRASLESLPVAQLSPKSLIASNKSIKSNFTVAQGADTPTNSDTPANSDTPTNVDINQLNEAISAYNDIILQSSPVALQQLVQDEDFIAFGKALKELRAAIN